MKTWSDSEVEMLRKNASRGMKIVCRLLNKTPTSIVTKASKLGIKIARVPKYDYAGHEFKNKKWSWSHRIKPKLKVSSSGCWLWSGSHSKMYGQIRIFVEGRSRLYSTHRVAWEVANNTLAGEFMILHKCDTPSCNNPDHLFKGDCRDNILDMMAKGRNGGQFVSGPRPGKRRLTDAQLKCARELFMSGVMLNDIADKYGMHKETLRRRVKKGYA